MKRNHALSVGPLLLKRRLALNMSQATMARAIGYSTSQFISQWEHGTCEVPPAKLPIIAEVLGLNLETLVRKSIESYAKEYREEVKKCQPTPKQRQELKK
jgi:transcriptional regulator with XRE-family HTH domain